MFGAMAAVVAPDSHRTRTLIVGLSSVPGPFDPAVARTAEQMVPVLRVYQRLLRRDQSPDLALRWRRTDVAGEWLFELDPAARFGDGGPVTAEAVVFSLNRAREFGRGASSDLVDSLAEVAAVSAHRVRIRFVQDQPRNLSILATHAASIVDPRIASRGGHNETSAWLASRSEGSGPYRLRGSQPGATQILERNPAWAGSPVWFEQIVFRSIPDPTLRFLALERGEVDFAVMAPGQALARLRRTPGISIEAGPVLAFQSLGFNLERSSFSDARLRRAIAQAIDTAAIVQHIRSGHASTFQGPLAPGMIGYDRSLYDIRYDPAAARTQAHVLLDREIRASLIYPGVSPETDTVVQYLQAVLAPLRIRVRLERLSIAAYIDRMTRGAYDLVLQSWVSPRDDASGILDFWFNPQRVGVDNPARYRDSETWRLIQRADATLDELERARLHRQIALRVNQALPYIYLQQTHVAHGLRNDIQGYAFDPGVPLEIPIDRMRRA